MCASIDEYLFKMYPNLNYMHKNNVKVCLISVSFWDHSLTELSLGTGLLLWVKLSYVNSHAV